MHFFLGLPTIAGNSPWRSHKATVSRNHTKLLFGAGVFGIIHDYTLSKYTMFSWLDIIRYPIIIHDPSIIKLLYIII